MDKTELIKKVAEETSVKEDVVRIVFNSIIDTIQKSLLFGVNVRIKGFLHFTLDRKPAREAMNPKTQEKIQIPKRYVVKTSLPKVFTDKIKNKTVY